MRWSEAVTLEFVKIYLKHECLWNPAHPGYKLKYQREKAYADIGSELKISTMKTISVPEVKMKIKNLRTTYVQQVHKIVQKSGPNSIYEPSLVWFNEMDRCLKNIPCNRKSVSHNSYNKTSQVDLSCEVWVDQDIHIDAPDIDPDPLTSQTEDVYDNLLKESSVKVERHTPVSFKKSNKRKISNRNQVQDFSINSNSESVSREDEFDIYGKFIASQLREMDLKKALKIQMEIQNLVSEARISAISSD